jgi:hypothetical protein
MLLPVRATVLHLREKDQAAHHSMMTTAIAYWSAIVTPRLFFLRAVS